MFRILRAKLRRKNETAKNEMIIWSKMSDVGRASERTNSLSCTEIG